MYARSRELDIQIEREKDVLRSFGITTFGPELENLDIAAVIARNVAERERKQASLEAAVAEAADAENQTASNEVTETDNGTKEDGTGAQDPGSGALEMQAAKVADTADETTETENSAQGFNSVSLPGAQQSHDHGQMNQAMEAEFDELSRPLAQSLGEVFDP